MAIVSALRTALVNKVGRERFNLWFGESTELTIHADRIVVTAPNPFFQEWLRRNFRPQIEAAVVQVLGRSAPVEFTVRPTGDAAPSHCPEKEPPGWHARPTSNHVSGSHAGANVVPCKSGQRRPPGRRHARLEDLIDGDSNRLALTTAGLVATNLGRWSPLFVHGPSGVGKTHLLEGLCSAVRQQHPDAATVFLTAEQFTSHFLEALRGSGLPSFRRKYRGVDLLVIDDLQFFAGKRATLVELLYTVNSLLDEGRQIALAADRCAAELAELGKELVHRLNGGMVCRIDPPDHAVRQGIVKQAAARMQLHLTEETVQFIASNLTSNARELIGAVNRLHAAQLTLGKPLTCQLAQEALAEMVRHGSKLVRLSDIEAAVCQVFGLQGNTLQSDRRAREVTYPRMLAMWLARKHTRAALSEIGDYFGHRTHSTVVSAQKKVNRWLEKQELLRLEFGQCTVDEAIRRVERTLQVG